MEVLSYTDAVGWGSDDEAVIPNDNQMFSFADVNCTAPEDVMLRCVDWKTKSDNILLAILQGRSKFRNSVGVELGLQNDTLHYYYYAQINLF